MQVRCWDRAVLGDLTNPMKPKVTCCSMLFAVAGADAVGVIVIVAVSSKTSLRAFTILFFIQCQ
jgi:hypothetical protein